VIKPFDQTLYQENDDAKHQVIEWLSAEGFEAMVNPDQYGIDILAEKNGQQYEIEVEVKHNWVGENFHLEKFISLQEKRSLQRKAN
jgi:hypothetical protein